MISWTFVLLLIGGITAAPKMRLSDYKVEAYDTNEQGRNSILENIVINALEDFRSTMVTGADPVPVLDPFELDELLLDDSIIPIESAYLHLTNLTVTELSSFVINDVNIDIVSALLGRYRVLLDFEVPHLEVHVDDYDLRVHGFGFNIFGKGDAKITLVKPRVILNLLVNVRLGIGALYLNIMECSIQFKMADIKSSIKGMFEDDSVESFVNNFLEHLVLDLINTYPDEITSAVSPIVMDIANDILNDINLIDLIN